MEVIGHCVIAHHAHVAHLCSMYVLMKVEPQASSLSVTAQLGPKYIMKIQVKLFLAIKLHPTATGFMLSSPWCTSHSPTLACALIPPTYDNGLFGSSFFSHCSQSVISIKIAIL